MRDEKNILSALYLSIIFLGFISISIEFDLVEYILALFLKPDLVSSIMLHLQNHSDFYKSIALGGLASAIISVITAQVSIVNHKKDTYLRYLSAARRLAGTFELTILEIDHFKDLEELDEIGFSNDVFKQQIDLFLEEVEMNQEEGNSIPEYIIRVCEDTFIPLQDDIKVFLSSMKESPWFKDSVNTVEWEKEYYRRICRKCVRVFILELDTKYGINKITAELYHNKLLSSYYATYVNRLKDRLNKIDSEKRYNEKRLKYKQLIDDVYWNERMHLKE